MIGIDGKEHEIKATFGFIIEKCGINVRGTIKFVIVDICGTKVK